MGISKAKKKIVIDNYFKVECDMNTSIKEAFTKGFELGLKKAPQPKTGKWMETDSADPYWYMCSECHRRLFEQEAFCPSCGAKMK